MKRFKDFINEGKNEISYEEFLKDVKNAVMRDFTRTSDQADAFINQYDIILSEYWENGFTTREAIAACKVPGVKISTDKVDESFVFQIDEDYEETYNKIDNLKINNLKSAEKLINEYFDKYSRKNYSDKRIFDRIKNNYKSLIKLYEEKIR